MTTDFARIRYDLAPFADLGTDPPHYSSDGTRAMVRMTRGGETLEIEFGAGKPKVVERVVDSHQLRTRASFRALLASERFADLRLWANNQSQSQRLLKDAYDHRIPVTGMLSDTDEERELDVEEFDEFLASEGLAEHSSVRITVIDGPAGIGKTRFIEFLAWLRATRFFSKRRPLVLHVQSRGRVLTYIQDLIAFSLQSANVEALEFFDSHMGAALLRRPRSGVSRAGCGEHSLRRSGVEDRAATMPRGRKEAVPARCRRSMAPGLGAGAWVVSAGGKLTNAGVSGEVRSGGAATAPVRRRSAAGGYARTPAPRGTSSTRRNRRWNAAP